MKAKIYEDTIVTNGDTKSLLENIYTSENNPGNSFTTKLRKYMAFGFLIFL